MNKRREIWLTSLLLLVLFGLQGRYFFGEMAPLFALMLMGLLAMIPKRWQGVLHPMLRLGMVVANFYCLLWVVLPRYYA